MKLKKIFKERSKMKNEKEKLMRKRTNKSNRKEKREK
jgi:hypothetical protein